MKWNQLQNENAPLRAMLNGKLQSVSEDIYDSFILREIAEQPEEKTVKENRCCMVCWIPCSSGLCCGYYFICFLNIRR